MTNRITAFDTYKSSASNLLMKVLNDGSEDDIPEKYIDCFCAMVVNSMCRCVCNAVRSCELFGDASGFEFNLGGYFDTYYEMDGIRWHGFSDGQTARLKNAYPDIIQPFRNVALDIIEHHLRTIHHHDIERAINYFTSPVGQKPHRTFRNIEYIAYECRDKKPTAEDIYNRFVERARELKHYK